MPRLRSVPVYSWNPRRNKLPVLRRFQVGPRVKNFGDLLGPVVVQGILKERGVGPALRRPGSGTVMAVGSVMHKAHDGDIVWGTGVNGKVALALHDFTRLDVRAVRGPRTREWLRENKGIEAPAIYGDPALLLPTLFPRLRTSAATKRHALAVVPNLNELGRFRSHPDFVDPRRPLWEVLERIASSEVVVGSSLHAIVIGEALGIPVGLIASSAEPPFKYQDYFEGTGRTASEYAMFDDFDAAHAHATGIRTDSYAPLAGWSPEPLLGAFPIDRWVRG
ncbi:polysaccharide pyruvyl transferase family protein [Rathayibacter sp. VKM Ac-2759]|uniref:polysaccharide pyruvyl transferase family protein n=1 Tax=Rathayibacter sp. VKM Ac-2759 TaxID=2609252 RepID=UPI001319A271|nr:polysaccharide pyruvyl transferase family protein [Rathayibacter sp. VKM Ac-2759]QHC68035.1 polysaccharide pyruvyl transferase family protein [Rathayibacter sp. VKM Ac-2759]